MTFYQNEGYVTPNLENDNPAHEIAHYLSYMNKPSSQLISVLKNDGYKITNQEEMMSAIIMYMAKGDSNVDEILTFHPHYEFIQGAISNDDDELNHQEHSFTHYSTEKTNHPFSHFELKFNGMSVLFFLVATFLIIKITESLTKSK